MSATATVQGFRCLVCGAEVDVSVAQPWRCPNATSADRHHVLDIVRRPGRFQAIEDPQPLVRFGGELAWQAFALANGMTTDAAQALVRQVDDRVATVAGIGFRTTPFTRADVLSADLGFAPNGGVWVKDETGNVAGSHKARHLVSILLHLKAAELLGVGGRETRLAIASCGNAALAAATLAAADHRELEVFVPTWANSAVVDALTRLRALVTVCPRRDDDPPGDPCVHRFREAVDAGAVPFSVQGPENALALDTGRTLGWEMSEAGVDLHRVFVQVGGGALAASVGRAFADAGAHPRLHAVQAAGCAPMERAWRKACEVGVERAARHWDECMWPWEDEPASEADGILDDETYDWLGVVAAVEDHDGSVVVAPEAAIVEAHELGMASTDIAASATGTAGLAGLLAIRDQIDDDERVAVIFSGVER